MRAVAGADDYRCDRRPVEDGPACDRGNIRAEAVGDPAKRAEECLEQVPSAEIVDDQLVLGERAVREGRYGLRGAEPVIGEESAGDGAINEEMDVVPAAKVGEAMLGPHVEKRILHLQPDRLAA